MIRVSNGIENILNLKIIHYLFSYLRSDTAYEFRGFLRVSPLVIGRAFLSPVHPGNKCFQPLDFNISVC